MRRFELIEGTASKFWEVQAEGEKLTVRFGRIGTHGQTQTKALASAAAAEKERDKLIKEKTGKGYTEVGTATGATLAAVAPKVAAAPAQTAPAAPPSEAKQADAAPGLPATPTAPAEPTYGTLDPAALDWPPERIEGELLEPALMPVVRGVYAPPFEASVALLNRPPELEDDAGNHSQEVLDVLARACGTRWTYWNRAGARQNLTRERLSSPDEAFWREACAQCVSNWHWRTVPHEWIVKVGVALHGLAFMARVMLPLRQNLPDNDKLYATFRVLRHAVAAAGHAAHDEALAAVAAARTASPEALLTSAFLFPHHAPWVDEALAQADKSSSLWLMTCVMAPEQLAAFMRRFSAVGYLASAMALQVRLHGVHAMPALEAGLALAKDRSQAESALEWITTVPCPAQIGVLVRQMEGAKETRALLDKVAAQYPAATLYTAIAHVLSAPSRMLEGWTLRLAVSQPEALAQALAALEPAKAQAFADMMAALTPPEAPAEALPALLRDPPWRRRQRPQALPTLTVPALPVQAAIHWPASELERLKALEKRPPWIHHELDKLLKTLGSPEAAVLRALGIGDAARHDILAGRAITADDLTFKSDRWSRQPAWLAFLPPALALRIWNEYPAHAWPPYFDDDVCAILARHGVAALPGFTAYCQRRPTEGLVLGSQVETADFARLATHALRNLKKAQASAQAWITRFPRTAAIVALQEAFSTDKAARDNGAFALRWMMRQGHEALIDQVAAEYGGDMPAALAALKSADPLNVLPARMPKPPAFFSPATFHRPRLKDGQALPVSAAEHIGTMLAISKPEAPYPGLDIVREACEPHSLAEFAWDLFEAWMAAGAPSKEGWAFQALGHLGDNDTVRRLTPKIREWPGESAHARAVAGLDLLALIGTDLALMNLNAIANKVKFKGLQDKAREKIAAIADARGLTPEQLADRLVPDLGLDEASALTLDFGPRQFTVAFDETLKPFVKDASGARLKDLPKPLKSDDATLSAAATERYKQLKKDAKAIASVQVIRLELAMTGQRRWSAEDFQLFFLQHPVMRFMAARLVWGVYRNGAFAEGFRVAEDFTLAGQDDDTYTLPPDASVGIAHVLEMPAEVQAAFGQILADYEILQPFKQIGRETYTLSPDELKGAKITRFAGKTVATGSVMGLVNRGWERGDAQDGGWVADFSKRLSETEVAVATLDPGTVVGDMSYEPKQRITEITVHRAGHDSWNWGDALPLTTLGAVATSELLRDVDLLAPYKEEA